MTEDRCSETKGYAGCVQRPRFPEDQSPLRAELPERYPRFAELREDFLLVYCRNTARAYWGDLEHLNDWCMERGWTSLTSPKRTSRSTWRG